VKKLDPAGSSGKILSIGSQTQLIGSIEFTCSSPASASAEMITLAKAETSHHVHLVNAFTVALADASPDYRETLKSPAINFPDGKPIGWMSAMKRQAPRLRQVRGPQLFLDVFDHGRSQNVKHYLLGSTTETLAKLVANLNERFPGIEIVGSESPPFAAPRLSELRDRDLRIRESGAEIVWVGLGTPKQDYEVRRIVQALPILAIAVGAAFDFAAGTAKQAPQWMTKVGLEWLHRLLSEPRRLWKRYLFGNLRFLKAVLFPKTAARNRII
jgi:N-acetylglucosaminyldiphosphoundecaprenol N-acetyl-beta-D-mannosaminyltransferase